jgi:O-antigen/teichoic acid export membrane protein
MYNSAVRVRLNILYNFGGGVAPILVSILTIPAYLRIIGDARYGILSIIWMVFGYFGLFDFGLSRATAHRLSKIRDHELRARATVFYTAVGLNAALGVSVATVFYIVTLPTMSVFLSNSAPLHDEILTSLPWIAGFFPLALLSGVLVGTMEAEERFLELNIQQVAGSILLQCLPLVFVYCSGPSLEHAVLGAIAARTASTAWLGFSCFRWVFPAGRPTIRMHDACELLRYGAWITVSNGLGPLLVSVDQLIIGLMLGPSAVAYYSVPFSMAMKMLIAPAAITRALFPRFSRVSHAETEILSRRSLMTLTSVMTLICVPAILIADPGLRWWISENFAHESHLTAEILLVGTWINGLAMLPFTLLQGRNRPDVIAKLHALEILPFIVVLWLCIKTMGQSGAALAWCIRVAADGGLMFLAAGYRAGSLKDLLLPALTVLGALAMSEFGRPNAVSTFSLVFVLGLMFWVSKHDEVLSAIITHGAQRILIAVLRTGE